MRSSSRRAGWTGRSISFDENDYTHKDVYICKGEGVETYTPTFTYHGFQYVLVKGLRPEQASKELLTFVVFHTRLRERGGFTCSDAAANALQAMVAPVHGFQFSPFSHRLPPAGEKRLDRRRFPVHRAHPAEFGAG